MKAPKKPRASSPLQMLPEDRQAEIIEQMKKLSTVEVRKWLADDGFKTSTAALSEFWSWWHLRRQFTQSQSDVETLLENIRKSDPGLSEDQLYNYGQQIFGVLAMKSEDAKDWARLQLVRQRQAKLALETNRIKILQERTKQLEEELKLSREKFEFDAAQAALAALPALRKIAGDKSLNDTDKLTQVRMKLFGSAPE